jgi:hypothetical protein
MTAPGLNMQGMMTGSSQTYAAATPVHTSVLHLIYAMWRPYYSELAQLCWARAAHYRPPGIFSAGTSKKPPIPCRFVL